jgi:hypothetical protein
MKKIIATISILILMGWTASAMAADSMSSNSHGAVSSETGPMKGMGHDQKNMDTMSGMEHMANMDHQGTYEKQVVTDGIRAKFQVMSLAGMNMKDSNGASHHIMVTFFNDATNQQIKNAIGKIKVINPDKKEQINALKDYNGIYAANFSFDLPGEYGVICLARIDGKDHVYKFWYPCH